MLNFTLVSRGNDILMDFEEHVPGQLSIHNTTITLGMLFATDESHQLRVTFNQTQIQTLPSQLELKFFEQGVVSYSLE